MLALLGGGQVTGEQVDLVQGLVLPLTSSMTLRISLTLSLSFHFLICKI